MSAACSEIQFEVNHDLKVKNKEPKEEESLPFGPSCAADWL